MASGGERTTVASPRGEVNPRGVWLVVGGVALTGLSFLQLPWYSVQAGSDSAGDGFLFADLHQNADQLGAPVAAAYFDWLAWTVLIALGVVGLAASLPTRIANVLRVIGFVLGIVGAVGTFYALAQLFNAQRIAGGSNHGVWHNSSLGVWLTLAGFLLAAVGAVLGPRSG